MQIKNNELHQFTAIFFVVVKSLRLNFTFENLEFSKAACHFVIFYSQ